MNGFILIRFFIVVLGIGVVVLPLMAILKVPLQLSMPICTLCGSLGVLFFLEFIEGDVGRRSRRVSGNIGPQKMSHSNNLSRSISIKFYHPGIFKCLKYYAKKFTNFLRFRFKVKSRSDIIPPSNKVSD